MTSPLAKLFAVATASAALVGAGCKWEVPNNTNTELAPLVHIGEVMPPAKAGRLMITPDALGGRVAYVLATPGSVDHEKQHIFIDTGDRTWEVFGLPFEGKPLDNLHWEGPGNHALVLDRWYSATQGVRVYIDMSSGSTFYAMPIDRPEPATRP